MISHDPWGEVSQLIMSVSKTRRLHSRPKDCHRQTSWACVLAWLLGLLTREPPLSVCRTRTAYGQHLRGGRLTLTHRRWSDALTARGVPARQHARIGRRQGPFCGYLRWQAGYCTGVLRADAPRPPGKQAVARWVAGRDALFHDRFWKDCTACARHQRPTARAP